MRNFLFILIFCFGFFSCSKDDNETSSSKPEYTYIEYNIPKINYITVYDVDKDYITIYIDYKDDNESIYERVYNIHIYNDEYDYKEKQVISNGNYKYIKVKTPLITNKYYIEIKEIGYFNKEKTFSYELESEYDEVIIDNYFDNYAHAPVINSLYLINKTKNNLEIGINYDYRGKGWYKLEYRCTIYDLNNELNIIKMQGICLGNGYDVNSININNLSLENGNYKLVIQFGTCYGANLFENNSPYSNLTNNTFEFFI